jgi:hypothetical protein
MLDYFKSLPTVRTWCEITKNCYEKVEEFAQSVYRGVLD